MTQELYRGQLKELVRSIRFSEGSIHVRNRKISLTSDQLLDARIDDSNHIISYLQQIIYNEFYCKPTSELKKPPEMQHDDEYSPVHFVNHLSQFNNVSELWDRGWIVQYFGPLGVVELVKSDKTRIARPGEFVVADLSQLPLRPGSIVNIYRHKESMDPAAYFYYILGGTLPPPQSGNQIRFYWSIKPEGMHLLVSHVTERLNRFKVPFSLKCPTQPTYFARSDAAVLYVRAEHVRLVCDLISSFYEDITIYLKAEHPLFTKPLAQGLSFAESPKDGESFGMNRAKICAEGLINSFHKQITDHDQKLSEVIETFERYGFEIVTIYRNPASHYPYSFGSFGD